MKPLNPRLSLRRVLMRNFVLSCTSFLVFTFILFLNFFVFTFLFRLGGSITVAAQTAVEKTEASWIRVMDLKVGDLLYTQNGWQEIDTIEYVQSDAPFSVYNLSVDEPNTFWAEGILVHNKSDPVLGCDQQKCNDVGGKDYCDKDKNLFCYQDHNRPYEGDWVCRNTGCPEDPDCICGTPARVIGRVRSYEPEEWYWRGRECTGCSNCHASASLEVVCTKDGGVNFSSWGCNPDAYYQSSEFLAGDTVSCTLSGLLSGYDCTNPSGCSATLTLEAGDNHYWFEISKEDIPPITLSGQVYCKDSITGTNIPWREAVDIRHINGDNTTVVATSSNGRWTATLPKSTWLGPSASSIRPDGGKTGVPEFSWASATDDSTEENNGIECRDSNIEGIAFDSVNDIYENQPGSCLRGESDPTLTNTTVDFNLGYCPASAVGCDINNMSDIIFSGVGETKSTPALTVVPVGGEDVLNVEFTVNDTSVARIVGSNIGTPPLYSVQMESLALTEDLTYTYTANAFLEGGTLCDTESAGIVVNTPGPWCQFKGGDAVTFGNIQCQVPDDPSGLFLMEENESGTPGIPIAGESILSPSDPAFISSTQWRVENNAYGGEMQSYYDFRERIPELVPETFASNYVYESTLLGSGTEYPVGSGYYYFEHESGVLYIRGETVDLGSKKVIVFADSDVNINAKITVDKGKGLFMLIASGDIEIDPLVGGDQESPDPQPDLEGIYYTDSNFYTGSSRPDADQQLHVRGSVVAGNSAGFGVVMDRVPAEAGVPGELFEFGADQSMLIPPQLSERLMTWKEVLP